MSPSRRTRRSPLAWTLASILLLAAVAASFWVPIYARSTPKLGAFPFFYWYQLLLVPAIAIVSWLAYLLVRTDTRTSQAAATPPLAAEAQPGVPEPGIEGGPEAAL